MVFGLEVLCPSIANQVKFLQLEVWDPTTWILIQKITNYIIVIALLFFGTPVTVSTVNRPLICAWHSVYKPRKNQFSRAALGKSQNVS